MRICSNVVAC